MKADSTDLRKRVVAACDAGGATPEEIAARFSVSVSWIRKPVRQRRETGSITRKPRGGGRSRAFDAEAAGRPRDAVRARADATPEELARAAGVTGRASAVHGAFARLGGPPRRRPRAGLPGLRRGDRLDRLRGLRRASPGPGLTARTVEAMGDALRAVRPDDGRGWFRHSG